MFHAVYASLESCISNILRDVTIASLTSNWPLPRPRDGFVRLKARDINAAYRLSTKLVAASSTNMQQGTPPFLVLLEV